MPNNRTFIYTRLDGQGNKIPGSSVQRQKMPRVGRWVQESVNECCFPFTSLTSTPADVTDTAFTVTVSCDATAIYTALITTTPATTTIDELVTLLNNKLPYLGSFSVDGSDIVLKLKTEVSDAYDCDGTLSFAVTTT